MFILRAEPGTSRSTSLKNSWRKLKENDVSLHEKNEFDAL